MANHRILIIRTGGLGDTLLLWPAVAGVRRRFPAAQIELMGNAARLALLLGEGGADRALSIEGAGYHHLLDVSELPPPEVRARFGAYDAVVAFAAPGDYALAENLSACGVGEVHAFLPFPPQGVRTHVADHALRELVGAGLAAEGATPPLPVSESERAAAEFVLDPLPSLASRFAVVAPGSGSEEKNWPPWRFAALIALLREAGLAPVLLEGPADAEPVAQVLRAIQVRDPTIPWPTVVREASEDALKGLLERATLCVGNDAGPTHLAALLGIPTAAIFGPTDPLLWAPIGPRVEVVRPAAACAPCAPPVREACPHRECLAKIEPEDVLHACGKLLRRLRAT